MLLQILLVNQASAFYGSRILQIPNINTYTYTRIDAANKALENSYFHFS